MLRTWASLLVAMFGFALIGPVAFSLDGDSNLHPCCRKDGKHRCGMSQGKESSSEPAFRIARCPLYGCDQTLPNPTPGLSKVTQATVAAVVGHPIRRPQTNAFGSIFFDGTFQKRGPPAS